MPCCDVIVAIATAVRSSFFILTIIILLFVETSRKFINAKLSIRKPGSSSVLIICSLVIVVLCQSDTLRF
jgi:hypothetical protein